jgi:hypothetical protein
MAEQAQNTTAQDATAKKEMLVVSKEDLANMIAEQVELQKIALRLKSDNRFRTKVCAFYLLGCCKNDNDCHYQHPAVSDELKQFFSDVHPSVLETAASIKRGMTKEATCHEGSNASDELEWNHNPVVWHSASASSSSKGKGKAPFSFEKGKGKGTFVFKGKGKGKGKED